MRLIPSREEACLRLERGSFRPQMSLFLTANGAYSDLEQGLFA